MCVPGKTGARVARGSAKVKSEFNGYRARPRVPWSHAGAAPSLDRWRPGVQPLQRSFLLNPTGSSGHEGFSMN